MNGRAIGLFAALLTGITVNVGVLSPHSVFAQDATGKPAADDGPIGKVLNVTGIAHIEHSAAVVVQANLPAGTGGGQTATACSRSLPAGQDARSGERPADMQIDVR